MNSVGAEAERLPPGNGASPAIGRASLIIGTESPVIGRASPVIGRESPINGTEALCFGKESFGFGKEALGTATGCLIFSSKIRKSFFGFRKSFPKEKYAIFKSAAVGE